MKFGRCSFIFSQSSFFDKFAYRTIASKLLLDTLNIDNKLRMFEYLNSKNFLNKGHKLNEPKALFPRLE